MSSNNTTKPTTEQPPDNVTPFRGKNPEAEKAALDVASQDGQTIPKEVTGPISVEDEKAALMAVRRFARGRGWILEDPCTFLRPIYRSYIDKSSGKATDEDGINRARVRIFWDPGGFVSNGDDDDPLTDDEKNLLTRHIKILEALADLYDLDGYAKLPPLKGGLLRWPLHSPHGKVIGRVYRLPTGERSKRYIAQVRREKDWVACPVLPCDVQPFVFGTDDHEPIIVTEGPKAMDGAKKVRRRPGSWGIMFNRATVISWHGADMGVDHTDWSMCAGRICYLMPDTDRAGLDNMLLVADAITRAGGKPVLLRFPHLDEDKGKDLADAVYIRDMPDWHDDVEPLFCNAITPFMPRRKNRAGKWVPPELNPAFVESWIWVNGQKLFYSQLTFEHYDSETLSARFPAVGKGSKSTASLLKAHRYKRDAVNLTFLPGSPYGLHKSGAFNLARPHPFFYLPAAPTEDLPPEFARYMKACIPEKEAREAVLDYAAHAIAHPNNPPGKGVIFFGRNHGQGKTTMATYLAGLAGPMAVMQVEDLFGKFSHPEMVGNVAAFVEEFFTHSPDTSGREVYNRSKSLTSKTLSINIKGMKQFNIPNVLRVWACTNQPNALLMEENDRRWIIVDFVSDQAMWEETEAWLAKDASRRAIYQALKRRGLNRGPVAPTFTPLTEAKKRMMAENVSKEELRLIGFLDTMAPGQCVIAQDMSSEFKVASHRIREIMTKHGMISLGQVAFPRQLKDGKTWQPRFSIWRCQDSGCDVEEIRKGLRVPGKFASSLWSTAKGPSATLDQEEGVS